MENKTQKDVRIKVWSNFLTTQFLGGIETVSAILKIENLSQENLIKVNQTKQRYKL
tara:strand:- start:350 stop:517 length:168 start_codon:yes stop_codon:yes gene_type:complete